MNIYLILLIIVTTYFLFRNNDRKDKINLKLKGPKKLPIVGNLLLYKGEKNIHLLYQKWYQKFGSVYHIKNGNVHVVVLTEFKTLRKAFIENSDAFASRYQRKSKLKLNNCQDVLMLNGYQHELLKSIALSSLTPTKIKKLENQFVSSQITKLIQSLDKHTESNEPFIINNYFKMFSLNIIISFIFGTSFPYNDVKEIENVVNLINSFVTISGYPFLTDYFNVPSFVDKYYWENITAPKRYLECYQTVTKIINELIDKFKKCQSETNSDETILSKMIQDYEAGKIESWDIVVGSVVDLFMAGSDTSANTIAFTIVEVINNPDIQNKLYNSISSSIEQEDKENDYVLVSNTKYRSSIPYLTMVIKESLRLHPAATLGAPHMLTEDVTIDGHQIAAGTQIIQNIYSTHRDEKIYSHPDSFIPERFLDSNLPNLYHFGVGVRDCLGKGLADSEIFSCLATILNRYEFINPDPSKPLDDFGIFGGTFGCPNTSVIIKKRK